VTSGRPDWYDQIIIGGSDIEVPISIKSSEITLDINIASSSATLNVNIESVRNGVVFNVAQSGDWTVNAAQTGDWTINIGNPLDDSGNLKTSIQSSVQLDVNIANSAVTLNVNITGSDVTLNVNVQGTASVSIDNANVYLGVENSNTRGGTAGFDNTANATSLLTDYAGFGVYVRNIRGGLIAVRLKVKETSGTDQELTIRFSINPLLPPIYETTIPVPANTDGTTSSTFMFDLWWDYDTIFVYIAETNPNVQVYAETGVWGTYAYKKIGNKFNTIDYGIGMMIKTYGGTFNSLPVSGIVNTISIPNVGSGFEAGFISVPANSSATLFNIKGTGKILFMWLDGRNTNLWHFEVYTDGGLAFRSDNLLIMGEVRNFTQAQFGLQVTRYDTTNHVYVLIFSVPIPFRKSLEIKIINENTTTDLNVWGQINVEKIA